MTSNILSRISTVILSFALLLGFVSPTVLLASNAYAQDTNSGDSSEDSDTTSDDDESADLGDEEDTDISATRSSLSTITSNTTKKAPKGYKESPKEKNDSQKVAKFSTKTQCLANVTKVDLDTAKSYSDARAKTRYTQLKKYAVRIDNADTKVKKSYKDELNKYKIDDQSNIKITTHKKAIKKEISSTREQIKAKRQAANKAKTSQEVAQQVCSMIFDIRVYTYLDGKIAQQASIDRLYRYNGLLQAQYDTLQKSNTANRSSETLKNTSNPLETRKKIDALQVKLDSVTPTLINDTQAKTKKKSLDIYKELLATEIKAAQDAIKVDIKTGNAAKSALKSATPKQTTQSDKKASPTKNTKAKKVKLSDKTINAICKDASNEALRTKNSLDKNLTKACNVGIKEGFKVKKSERNADKFCQTAGGKWKASKSPKKVEACKMAYDKGAAVKDALSNKETSSNDSCSGDVCPLLNLQ